MKPAARPETDKPETRPSQDAGKLVIKGVMTHEKLMSMIKRVNPIIARVHEPRD
jgi:hypothetical protein